MSVDGKLNKSGLNSWQLKMHEIIYEADTPMGKLFDVCLLWAIIASLLVVMLESVESIRVEYGSALRLTELFFTLLFTIEYVLRVISVEKPFKYMFSFMGLVDILSIMPTYLSFFVSGPQFLIVIRSVRLLRVFRIFKLARYISEAHILIQALKASKAKITVFLGAVLTLSVIMGTIMYIIESSESGFTSIPRSIYWAIVTLTTVGYGDIAPVTVLGQAVASFIMILGYSVIAVPTGIVSAELSRDFPKQITSQSCIHCSKEGHDVDAEYCKYCGETLNEQNER
ncbi:MAG: ion transporter [Flavobacteriales bacterium]|nr:ion transporter [Flavobacteriales bacterium]